MRQFIVKQPPESVSLASADAAKLLIWLTNPSGLILTTDHPAGELKWGIRFDTADPAEHHAPIAYFGERDR